MERDAADLRRSPRRGRTQPDAERRVAHGAARRREQARIEGSADCRIGRRRLKSQNSSTRSVLPDAKQQRRIAWAARIGGLHPRALPSGATLTKGFYLSVYVNSM